MSTWVTIAYVTSGTAAIYVTMLVGVRLAGRRTISQLSAFDAVVTVALGSTLATTALGPDPSYAEGAAVIATLLGLQIVIATARQRSPRLRRLVDFPPEPLVTDGEQSLRTTPLSSQVSPDELWSLLRKRGIFRIDDVALVLLEPTGDISVARTRADADAARRHGDAL